ncbi:hypothetical protein M404DRAFT_624471 [Pisolithus tinctorius Marx 270]|uniref:Uncharacterized protein n=1 Tax=Pisolithus tinctorius Marx 270 TaxID=870435 RepID=A0A0C3NRM7_PISTI|nr:hypothetical protein M404DRAFT_624471 [Pisolithus tinctorius Marx 270]
MGVQPRGSKKGFRKGADDLATHEVALFIESTTKRARPMRCLMSEKEKGGSAAWPASDGVGETVKLVQVKATGRLWRGRRRRE